MGRFLDFVQLVFLRRKMHLNRFRILHINLENCYFHARVHSPNLLTNRFTHRNGAKDKKPLDLHLLSSTVNPLPKFIFLHLRGHKFLRLLIKIQIFHFKKLHIDLNSTNLDILKFITKNSLVTFEF